jgi:uncharacterized protein (TIGR02271 family)
MTTKEQGTVIGVFTNHDDARKAVVALKGAGFTEAQIGVASANRTTESAAIGDADDSYAGEGALTGAATGAGIGALWGLGIIAGILPAIGPAIAGGTLAVLLSSAAAGAAAAGLAGALIGMGLSKEEAEFYETEMKAGRTIVTVNAGTRRDEALRLMRQFGGYDVTRDSLTGRAAQSTRADAAEGQTLQAHEEHLRVHKTPREAGEVKVRKEVHTDHKTIDVPVMREEVVVERHPASGQKVSGSNLQEGQEIRIPIKEEQVSVEKETVVAEEVSVGKRKVQDTKHIDETLRKERIDVETEGNVNVRDQRE